MELPDFLDRLDNVKSLAGGQYGARCPAHEDRVSSLSVAAGQQGGIVVRCFAGCTAESVVAALHLTMADLAGIPEWVATYVYTDEFGRALYAVERWANPKTFRAVNMPEPAGRVLYQLPAVNWAREHGAILYVVEGEKDCDNLAAVGIPATTGAGGAGKWLPQYSQQLAGCRVVVVADNDVPGRAHARRVAAELRATVAELALAVPTFGKDVSDLLAAGYGMDALEPLSATEAIGAYDASTIPVRPISWAWQDYMALGKLSLIEGDPGDGKSLLTVDLAARWSTGRTMPDGTNGVGPWTVVMVSAEDDPEDTIVPRLLAAKADLHRVVCVPHGADPAIPFSLTVDLPGLELKIRESAARIVCMDPLSAFLGEKTDSHNDASVRRALYPLKLLASRTGVAVVVVRHLNKGTGGKAIYRGGGSIAFTAAARATFNVGPHPEDPELRVMTCVKSNLARRPPALGYRIENVGMHPHIEWQGMVDIDAQTILDGSDGELAKRRTGRKLEREFLAEALAAGPLSWAEIMVLGRDNGFREMTLVRARNDLKLVKVAGPGGGRGVRWALPQIPTQRDVRSPFGHLVTPDVSANERPSDQMGSPSYARSQERDTRDDELDKLPLVCSACSTTENVTRFYEPWWVVRCTKHNPMAMGE